MTEPTQEGVLIERGLYEQVVEGLRRMNTLAVHNHTDAFDPTRWLIEIAEESQRLLAQLEAHGKEGA